MNSASKCPLCAEPVVPEFRPFCSDRCKKLDLNRWLSGVYAIPVSLEDESDGEAEFDAS